MNDQQQFSLIKHLAGMTGPVDKKYGEPSGGRLLNGEKPDNLVPGFCTVTRRQTAPPITICRRGRRPCSDKCSGPADLGSAAFNTVRPAMAWVSRGKRMTRCAIILKMITLPMLPSPLREVVGRTTGKIRPPGGRITMTIRAACIQGQYVAAGADWRCAPRNRVATACSGRVMAPLTCGRRSALGSVGRSRIGVDMASRGGQSQEGIDCLLNLINGHAPIVIFINADEYRVDPQEHIDRRLHFGNSDVSVRITITRCLSVVAHKHQ